MDAKQRVEGREELSEGNDVSERAESGRKLGDEAEATAAMAERVQSREMCAWQQKREGGPWS